MADKQEILDKDEFSSVPPSRKSGLTSMAEKLEKLLAGDEPASVPDAGSSGEPGVPAAQPEPAKTAPTPKPAKEPEKPETPAIQAPPALKTVSGLKSEPDKSNAPDEPAPSFDVADDEVPPTIKSAKAADDFKKIKRSLKETQHKLGLAEKVLKDRESEIATLKSKPATPPGPTQESYDAILKERTDLLERLETVALERSPQFQSKYKNAFDSSIARAKTAVGEKYSQQIESLMTLPPSKYRNAQIEEIRKEIESGLDQGQLDIAIHEMDKARDEMNAALSNHRTTLAAMTDEQKKKEQAQKEALANRILGMEKRALELSAQSSAFELNDSDPDHNSRATQRLDRVRKFIRGDATEDEIVQAAVLAEENLFLTGEYIPRLLKTLTDMEGEIKMMKGVSPSTSGVGQTTKTAQAKEKKGFADRFMAEYQEPPT